MILRYLKKLEIDYLSMHEKTAQTLLTLRCYEIFNGFFAGVQSEDLMNGK